MHDRSYSGRVKSPDTTPPRMRLDETQAYDNWRTALRARRDAHKLRSALMSEVRRTEVTKAIERAERAVAMTRLELEMAALGDGT